VAFLVDPTDPNLDSVLDAVADFSCDTWGGAYNPIVPITNGVVPTNFWPILEVADPDIFYSYAKLDGQEIRRLDTSFNPTRMIQHRYDGPHYEVWIQGQATTESEILNLRTRPGSKSWQVLTWSPEEEPDRFIRRNFGASRLAYNLAAHQYPVPTAPTTLTRELLCRAMARGSVVSPRFLSSTAPVKRELAASASRLLEFRIFYGDSAWNFLHFWNEASRHGFPDLKIPSWIEAVWAPNELASRDKVRPVLDLIKTQLRRKPDHFRLTVRIISYDHDEPEMGEFADVIKEALEDQASFKCIALRPETYDPGRVIPYRPMKAELPQHDHKRGPHFFLAPVERPAGIIGEEIWMADIQIQSPDEGTSEASWWALPKRSGIARRIHDQSLSRVIEEGVLSVEVSTRTQKIEVTLPSDTDMFTELLTRQTEYSNTVDMRYPLREYPPEMFVSISDKGKYFSGVVGLFGSLRSAGSWAAHPFWRNFLNDYSSPRNSDQALGKLKKDIAKSAEDFVKQHAMQKDAAISWLAQTILRSLRNIPQIRDTFTFEDLNKRWENHLATLGFNERAAAEIESVKEALSDMSNNKVLLQGCKVRCQNCLSANWYHIDDLSAEFPCQGCRRYITLPVEIPWSYQINELVRTAIREHGIGPVLRTGYRLMREAKSFFRVLVGVELHEMADQDTAAIGEFDICWVSDGRFGFAEVKTSAKDFSAHECAKIVRLAKRVHPDDVLIAAVDGSDEVVEHARSTIQQQLEGSTVRSFVPSSFNP
jgi:hypothetical protein